MTTLLAVWNERPYSSDYVKTLRQMLDASGFGNTGILCDDAKYACVPDILKDPELAAAVAYVGGHDPGGCQVLVSVAMAAVDVIGCSPM